MKTLKKIAFWFVSYTIRIVLFAAIMTGVIVVIIGKPSNVKQVINQANSYQRFVPAVIDANKAANPATNSLNYDDPNIVKIFTDSFPAADLQKNTETVIDSVYAWLEGKTPTLHFTADFTKNKVVLADKLSAYAFERLAHLPKCKELPAEVNPLTIQCQPAGFNDPEVRASYREQLLQSDSFLSKTTLTQNDLPKNAKGQTLSEQFYFSPSVYRWTLRAPYILGVLVVVMSICYVLLSAKRRRGVSGLGTVFMGAGITLAVFPILSDIILPRFTKSFTVQSGTSGTQAIFSDITSQISHHFDTLLIAVGIQAFILGLSIYLLEKATHNDLSKYKNIDKKSGVASSNAKPTASPKSLRGKLTADTVPLQSSDRPAKSDPKKVAENNKYRKLYSNKGRK